MRCGTSAREHVFCVQTEAGEGGGRGIAFRAVIEFEAAPAVFGETNPFAASFQQQRKFVGREAWCLRRAMRR